MLHDRDVWLDAPARPALGADEVDIWRAHLDRTEAETARFHALLCAEERARAARFSFDDVRRRFIVGRGIMRLILGRYLGAPAAGLRFVYGSHGKPDLAAEDNPLGLQFNNSDSHGQAVYAVAVRRQVGIDLERIRSDVATDKLARRYYAEAETEALAGLPDEQRHAGFFRLWTRKEAYVKAIGLGLSFPLKDFVVSLDPDSEARIVSICGSAEDAARWTLRALWPAPEFAGAIVIEGTNAKLRFWQSGD